MMKHLILAFMSMMAGGLATAADKPNIILILADDIAEENNLATTRPEKAKAMGKLLDQWEAEMSKTAAPFPSAESTPNKRKRKRE